MRRMTTTSPCPCGLTDTQRGPIPYTVCCGALIDQIDVALAPDAERLMRSRYSAFVHERADYLRATWHSSTRPASVDFETGVKWLGLEVRDHQLTGDHTAEVTFVARYRLPSGAVRMHERSRFVREDGRWFYVDGDVL